MNFVISVAVFAGIMGLGYYGINRFNRFLDDSESNRNPGGN